MSMKSYSMSWLAALALYALPGHAATVTGKAPVVATGQVTLSNRGYVYTATFDSNGNYKFPSVEAGVYALKAEVTGYNQAKAISVDVTKADTVNVTDLVLEKYTEAVNSYSYTWIQDQSYAGLPKTEVSQNVVKPVSVTILGKAYQMANVAYAQELFNRYGIVLNNAGVAWNQEYAYRLYAVLDRIPQISGTNYKYDSNVNPTQWTLTNDFIAGDIEITSGTVRISTTAFTYAAPLVVELNGVRGVYFSKRLHHALVNFVTNYGNNQEAVAKILNERFGLTIDTDARPLNYSAFTNESPSRFQKWFKHPAEIVEVINNFEELPEGMHKISGFKWLVRRLDGTVNPRNPAAPAIAWTNGYMEFMESAYTSFDAAFIARLILHEKAHYVYQFLLSNTFKKEWANLGGWQSVVNPSNPDYDAINGWQTTKTTEFVNAYAHDKNPNEDFAESVAYFVKNPNLLKARSIAKYNFIRDNVMLSTSYVSVIRPDLTFTVLNLYPTYDYPGKIKRIATTVTGAPQDDKTLTVEIEITPFSANSSANSLSARIMSPVSTTAKVATYFDMNFAPVNNSRTIFRSTQVLSKYLRSGYWQMPNIRIASTTGLERYESSLLYGFKCYVNNPLEDTIVPTVRPNTTSITVRSGVVDGHPVQIATVKFDVAENTGLTYYYASLVPEAAHSLEKYSPGAVSGEGTRSIDFYIKEYAPSGRYTLNQIALKDYGLNLNYTFFNTSGGHSDGTTVKLDESAPSVMITTPRPDLIAPELDVNRITVSAVPTNLTTPDGETLVTIKYFVRDNISGYGGYSSLSLRDPQGVERLYPTRHRNSSTEYFDGDPTVWTQYTEEIILPRGSMPGTWGLSQMKLTDKAGQSKAYSFTEIIRFDPYSTASARAITTPPITTPSVPAPAPVVTTPAPVVTTPAPVYNVQALNSNGGLRVGFDSNYSGEIVYNVATGSYTLDATPAPGYVFLNWEIISGNATIVEVNKQTTEVQVTGDVLLTAVFEPVYIQEEVIGSTERAISNVAVLDVDVTDSGLWQVSNDQGDSWQNIDSNVYVTDTENGAISKIDLEEVITTLTLPESVTSDTDGNLYTFDTDGNLHVVDISNAMIRKVTVTGAVTTLILTEELRLLVTF